MSENGIELMVKKVILKGFKAEGSIVAIAYGAFDGCHNLQKIIFREGLLKIGEGAFLGCEKLKKVTLPKASKSSGTGPLPAATAWKKPRFRGVRKGGGRLSTGRRK